MSIIIHNSGKWYRFCCW